MSETAASKLYHRVTRWRWQAPLLAFLLVLAHQLVEHTLLVHLPRWQHFTTQLLFYGVVGPLLAWWALTSLRRSVAETDAAERALAEMHTALIKANEQLAFLIRINRHLAEAEDEDTLTSMILALPLEVLPAAGCSLIRFDEKHQPLPAVHHGNLEPAEFEAWSSHLMDPDHRQHCACCTVRTATTGVSCPLLAAAPHTMSVQKVYCLALACGDREFGILSIYLEDPERPTETEQSLLEAMAQEMSMALESHYLRSRELDMLSRLQLANRLSNLHDLLVGVLSHTIEALEADGGILFLVHEETAELQVQAEVGQSLDTALAFVQGVATSTRQSNTPIIIRDLEQAGNDQVRSLLAASLRTDNQVLGSLVLWATRTEVFTRRRAQLVEIVAGQAALLIENQRLYLHGEHRIALDERARLAREIHDGLAQTLGYLKLRADQIIGWLQQGQIDQATTGLTETRQLIDEACVDAREAIDGLRLKASDGDMHQWIDEIVSEFEMLSHISVKAATPPDIPLPLEVHTQLQRIVQEVFSNIRKHADATCAWIEWQLENDWLTLRIRDNGQGFDPDDVPPIARHGLRIMRERTELLEADFQIISRPGNGTQVVINLPLRKTASERRNG